MTDDTVPTPPQGTERPEVAVPEIEELVRAELTQVRVKLQRLREARAATAAAIRQLADREEILSRQLAAAERASKAIAKRRGAAAEAS